MKIGNYYVYILICENGAYYTGYTTDLKRRFDEHLQGTANCKFTRAFRPLNIAQSWQIAGTKSLAMRVERSIKKMSKKEKEQLILFPEQLATLLEVIEV